MSDNEKLQEQKAKEETELKEAEEMAEKETRALTGAGLWGVEIFLSHENHFG